MRKDIRIDGATGEVLDTERTIYVRRDKKRGGPDKVRWIINGKSSLAPFRVHFAHSPFDALANAEDITVPSSGKSDTLTVAAPVENYKYSIYDKDDNKTDDPSIIIVH